MAQDLQSVLDPLPVNKELKAQAWDAFQQAKTTDELVQKLQSVGIPKEAKAALWDLKAASAVTPTTADLPVTPPVESGMEQAIGMGKDFVTGVGQSAASAIQGGGNMIRKIPGIGPLLDSAGSVDTGFNMTPQNKTQEMGKLAGDVGQFLLPETAIGKLAGGSKIARGAMEALSAAGITKAQGGDASTAALASGTFSALAPVGRAVASRLPAGIVNMMLRSTKNAFTFGKNPGKAIADEGIVAGTIGGAIEKLKAAEKRLWPQLEAKLKAGSNSILNGMIDMKAAIKPVDDAIVEAGSQNDQALVNRLREFRDSVTHVTQENATTGKIEKIAARADKLPAYDATLVKRQVGRGVKWTGNDSFEQELNKVRASVYRNIDAQVDKAVPGIEKLNSQYSNVAGAIKAAERVSTLSHSKIGDLLPLVGGFALHGIPGATVAVALKEALGTTAGATSAAQIIKTLPKMAPATRALVLAELKKNESTQ